MNLVRISSIIKYDHLTVNQLYQNYLMCRGNYPMQQLYTNQFLRELFKHSTAEEMVVYPAFERYMGLQGKIMADKDRMEHQTTKALMCLLAATPIIDPRHAAIFCLLINNLNSHIFEEECHDLPKFESMITPYCSAMLAQLFQRTKASLFP